MTPSLSFVRQGDKANSTWFEEWIVRLLEDRDQSGLTAMIHEIDALMITVTANLFSRHPRPGQ